MLISEINALNCRCYDAQADYWNRFPFPEQLPTLLRRFYDVRLGNKVLDIGSGTGKVACYLKNGGFKVTCLDPSNEMVRRCQELGLETIQTTIQEFDTEETYGMVIAILSLIHVPKDAFEEQIKKVHRFLKPHGIFILSLLKGHTEKIEECKSGFPRYFTRFMPDEVRCILQSYFRELAYHEQGDYMLFFFESK